ncbi:MAG: amidohydrolase [Firmicutes bacterium]|nr:amidohydrolase [Bacillota bacterium]
MIIDIHAHIWADRYETDKKEIIKACEMYNISKVYISGLRSYYPDKDEISELNYEAYRFMKEYPEHIGGFCYVNPVHDNSINVLKKGIEEYGMSGMKLWVATYCDDPLVFPLVEKCIEYNVPILVHAFKKTINQLEFETTGPNTANLARKYPEARIIMAHLGGNSYHGIKAIRDLKNVWVDISGSIFRRDDVDYTVEQIGVERILFGTDMPGSYLVNLGQIEEANLTPEEKELIYYKNAIKVLG